VKVAPLYIHTRPAKGIAEAGLSCDPEPELEEEDATASSEAPSTTGKRKSRARTKRPSPVAVIARALNGYSHPTTDPVTIIARAIEPSPQSGAERREPVFWDIWLAHRNYLRAHALRFSGGNLSDAEDAMSEAMLKAANAFNKTIIHNQRGWLLRLVHNACMDHHRNNRRQRRLATDIGDDDAQSAPAFAIQPERSPEELLVAMQQIGGLERALDALPKFLAEPLMLHLDERSDAEIAETLNLSREVVRKRRQMARALLRQSVNF
jgi:RNA polymerase sigma factor (sigma-70 family)